MNISVANVLAFEVYVWCACACACVCACVCDKPIIWSKLLLTLPYRCPCHMQILGKNLCYKLYYPVDGCASNYVLMVLDEPV